MLTNVIFICKFVFIYSVNSYMRTLNCNKHWICLQSVTTEIYQDNILVDIFFLKGGGWQNNFLWPLHTNKVVI